MDRKAILSCNGARLGSGQKQNIRNFNQAGVKRNNEHLSTRGPPTKVYFGNNHQLLRSRTVPYERNPILRKRIYSTYDNCLSTEFNFNRPPIPAKLPKQNVEDDVEEMIKQFEKWEQDDCKENQGKIKKTSGRRIWHIEAYIVQNVFEESTATPPETIVEAQD